MVFVVVAVVYEAEEVWVGLLALAAALLPWRAMRDYPRARRRLR
jgi:hypothetical protein